MDKIGSIPKQAACTHCGGEGCERCQQAGRTYRCAVCGKYKCGHLMNEDDKGKEGVSDGKRTGST